MDTPRLDLVQGHRKENVGQGWRRAVETVIHAAIDAGFRIGQQVRIGRVRGSIVGYNIGATGRYSGDRYPLLVDTEFGVTKCSLHEVTACA